MSASQLAEDAAGWRAGGGGVVLRAVASSPAAAREREGPPRLPALTRSLRAIPTWVWIATAALAALIINLSSLTACGPWDPWETHYGEVESTTAVRIPAARARTFTGARARALGRAHRRHTT